MHHASWIMHHTSCIVYCASCIKHHMRSRNIMPWNLTSWNVRSWNMTSWDMTSWNMTSWNMTSCNMTSWNIKSWNMTSWKITSLKENQEFLNPKAFCVEDQFIFKTKIVFFYLNELGSWFRRKKLSDLEKELEETLSVTLLILAKL